MRDKSTKSDRTDLVGIRLTSFSGRSFTSVRRFNPRHAAKLVEKRNKANGQYRYSVIK